MTDRWTPDISFIVPVRGDSPFLSEAILSALKVSPSKTEVIVVLDGPAPSLASPLERLLELYPGLNIISRPPEGAGAARNHGIFVARGEFVSFLDADDVILSASMGRLLMMAREHSSDVVCGLIECFREGTRWIPLSWKELGAVSAINTSCLEHPEALRHNSACGKIYRRDFLRTRAVAFPTDVHRGEDWQFSLSVIRHTDRLTLVPEVAYRYRKYHDALATQSSRPCPKLFGDLLIVRDRLNALYGGFDTAEMRLTRDTHFTESLVTHLKRLSNRGSSPCVLVPVLNQLSSSLSTMSPSALKRRCVRERLGLELIRAGALLAGLAFFGARDVPAIQQLQRFPEVSLDPRALVATKQFARGHGWFPRTLRATLRYLRERTRPVTDYLPCLLPLMRGKALMARLLSHFRTNEPESWVIGERGGYNGHDSSFYFFRWMRTHYPLQPCYFVVEPSEMESVPIALRPWILRRGTWEHYRRLYRASVLVFNFSGVDLCRDWRLLGILGHLPKATLRVFLNHGITAIHKVNGYWHREQMAQRYDECDIFCVSSSRERAFLVNDLKHRDTDVMITGLTRVDSLSRRTPSATGKRRIVYVPTWRPWLRYGTDAAFTGSRFYAEVVLLMTSPALQEFLNQEDAEIILLGHHVFKPFMPYLQELARDRVIVWDMNTQNTQAVLSSADLMITDYSSASFDCAYMGIPVLFFQFDQDHFYQQRGGYFVDPDRELPGRVVRTREELLTEVLCVAERNWEADAEFADRIDLFFDHRDGNNCSRLYDAIQERVSVARRGKTKM